MYSSARLFFVSAFLLFTAYSFSQETIVVEIEDVDSAQISDSGEVFVFVEDQPEFPGGDEARIKYLQENIIYPELAKESNIQGTVYVTFIVEKDGQITNVKVLRGIGGGCDIESVRVIKNMPLWKPGAQRGKAVRCMFNMPLRYVLAGSSGSSLSKKEKKALEKEKKKKEKSSKKLPKAH